MQGGPKKALSFEIWNLKLCFKFFFHIFQVVYTTSLGDSFDTNMDPTGRYTTQQRIKIIETYFATKSVLLTQQQCRNFCWISEFPELLLWRTSQKNWFCGKVCLDDFYPLLRSKSSWIHTGIKRISQACCVHYLKNMEKNCKTRLLHEKQK